MKKRILSLLMCIMLLVSLMPASAFATTTQAYYFIGTQDEIYTKVYDGKKLQADVLTYDGYLNTDNYETQITNGNITHVNQYGTMTYDENLGKNIGTLDLHYDAGYPKVFRNGVDVTSEYTQTQVKDITDKTSGCMTFTIISRDITLKSKDLTKEYDGKALTAYSTAGGTTVSDLTAGQTDKGYVSGEEFTYSFTGSQLFVGESDNSFNVTDSNTSLTSDYNVTTQYGKLTVTGRTAPLTITVDDQEKSYDGTASFDTTAYTVSGDLAYGDTITVTLSNSNKNAGTYTDGITATYMIMHNNGDGTYADVTDMYLNVTVENGDFTINKRNVTITSASNSKRYDGTQLTKNETSVTSGNFVSGEGYDANVTGIQTAIGSSPNYFTVSAAAGTNMNNYNITKVEGTLTVTGWEQLVTITADSNSKMYDGTALTAGGYTITGLAAGHTATVTVSGEITHFGTADNTVTSYTIYDENGEDVTISYSNIQTVKGTLEITKRDVTLTSATDSKEYDGTPLTNSNVSVSGYGFVSGEGATYNVTGSQTAGGSSKNTFSYVLNSSTSADDYEITTAEGTLTVTEAEFIITIDTEIGSGLEFLYDNTSTKTLTADQYQVEGLVAGDEVRNVIITTNSSNAGNYAEDMYTLSYDVVNASGVSTKGSYIITEYKHDIDITKRTITIEADSASKVYDGTPLTCHTYTVVEGTTEEEKLLAGETVNVGTITHVGSTAIDVTIKKADGSDSSMNYNIPPVYATLTVTARGVLLQSVSEDKYYDGTALQNRRVIVTGFSYDEYGNVIVDENGGFLPGDGCTYDFVNDNIVIDKDGNIIAWTVSEQSGTAYGQTEVGTSKNEFNYNNFTSVYYGSKETDYVIMFGMNQEALGLSKDNQDLFGDLTVWGGPVEINLVDYSVIVTKNEDGTDEVVTTIENNATSSPIALLGSDTLVVKVIDGNVDEYTIYRNGIDVTDEVEDYYRISINKTTSHSANNTSKGSEEQNNAPGTEEDLSGLRVEIKMTDYSWTYDYQAKTNGYFDDGYTVVVIANGEKKEYVIKHNAEGYDIPLLNNDTISVNVTGEKVQHVGNNKQNTASYTIKRGGVDMTDDLADGYNISISGGLLKIVPRTVEISKGEGNTVIEEGFIFGEGAAYEVNENSIIISELLTDTNAADYSFDIESNEDDNDDPEPTPTPEVIAYMVKIADNEHGTITSSNNAACAGTAITLTVKAYKGWTLETITAVDPSGKEIPLTAIEEGEIYTLTMPWAPVTIKATYIEDNTMLNYFADVKAADEYYDAVLWAVENGITYGVDEFHFNPEDTTTRGQMVTFLWRAAGCPEPSSTTCKFTDVKEDAYYYKAVLWAVEKGITDGTSATTFSPDAVITRAQAVTFLWRYEGSIKFANMTATGPAPSPFTDVDTKAYYYNAVLWAKAQGITSGVSDTEFAPDETCTRAMVVSYLYRDIVK